jgi:hypothetical protein
MRCRCKSGGRLETDLITVVNACATVPTVPRIGMVEDEVGEN